MSKLIEWSLTHWGRVTHISVSELTIICSDNGLSPGRRQAIIWINARILLIRPLGTNFNEILIEISIISFKNIHLKMSSGKWRPFCLGLNELIQAVPGHQTGDKPLHTTIDVHPLSIGNPGKNYESWIKLQNSSFNKMHMKMLSTE